MGIPAGRPPVVGSAATQIRAWIDELTREAAKLLLEDGDGERDERLAMLAVNRFIELHVTSQRKPMVAAAHAAGCSNESAAWALGLRPQTTLKLFPPPRRGSGWTRRTETTGETTGTDHH